MVPVPRNVAQDMEHLGSLAMRFRGTRDDAERCFIAREYALAVGRLIRSGRWEEAPAMEDMLPDEFMPREFYDYWIGPETPAPTGT